MSHSVMRARQPTASWRGVSPTSRPLVIRQTPNGVSRCMQSRTMSM